MLLHDVVRTWIQMPLSELTPAAEASLRGEVLNVQASGLDISWLVKSFEEVKLSVKRAAAV